MRRWFAIQSGSEREAFVLFISSHDRHLPSSSSSAASVSSCTTPSTIRQLGDDELIVDVGNEWGHPRVLHVADRTHALIQSIMIQTAQLYSSTLSSLYSIASYRPLMALIG